MVVLLVVVLLLLHSNMRGVGHLSRFPFSVKRSPVFSSDPLGIEGIRYDLTGGGGGFRINFNIAPNPLGSPFRMR